MGAAISALPASSGRILDCHFFADLHGSDVFASPTLYTTRVLSFRRRFMYLRYSSNCERNGNPTGDSIVTRGY